MSLYPARILRLALFAVAGPAAWADVQVTINPAIQNQSIIGWGASSWVPQQITPALREELIGMAVDELGLTRLRLEPPGGNAAHQRRWEWENDNADPNDTNWDALNTADMDGRLAEMVLPFKQRVEANQDPFNIYLSPSFFNGGSTGAVPPWLFHCPAEYAEFATSMLRYLKDVHGLNVDYYCILNEAGNDNAFWEPAVATMIKAVGPKMAEYGLTTRIQFPESINANTSWGFINSLRNDAAIWPYIGLLSYHLYGTGLTDVNRAKIRDFGAARGLPTAQTEYMSLNMDILYADFTNGGVSVWEVYGITSQFEARYERLRRQSNYWKFRQVLRYVRPGAVRVNATSADTNLRALAFRKGARDTVVLINGTGDRRALVGPLPVGTYTVSRTVGSGPYQEMGLHVTDVAGVLTVDVPSEAVATIQTYGGANLPPVPTKWESEQEFLTQPASAVTLSALATDPELDALTYTWSINSQPDGAVASLTAPDGAATSATGLTVAGTYVFTVAISDGTETATRDVRVPVFATNQPPMANDVHNRNPVLITLPQSSTTLRAGGFDLEADALSYQWEISSQPPEASAALATPNSNSCVASNMTVAGDYVFRVAVSDATHTVYEVLTVPVYPVNAAPQILSVTATPHVLPLPGTDGVTQLSATTSDADGDIISYWWSLVSKPASAAPVIVSPATMNTQITGLTVQGSYVFRLTAVDRASVTTRDITVNVRTIPGDMDADLDVDQEDFGLFQACITGQDVAQTLPACSKAKLDGDSDVDIGDADKFLACLSVSGPGVQGDPECGN